MKPRLQSKEFKLWGSWFYLSLDCQFVWIGRFLFVWGWNWKKNTFSITLYEPDLETEIWTIGEY